MGRKTHAILAILGAFWLTSCGVETASAQGREPPYWASLRYDETNMRVGPSREYHIEWVYRRKGLPVRVLRSRDEWDLVQDPEGTQGWISGSQLSRTRTVLITGNAIVALREEPQAASRLLWRAEPGVVAQLLRCQKDWCEIDASGRTGWVKASQLWGDENVVAEEREAG
ncbi:MAG: SH3 domain-containing protein [Erythrobacter sp.]|uniref:SH3 domain-containing protein n=1 Tax=Erythrobacter sp. TaxID=1042 RepID=UPI00263897C9|nr:SH3 domain-containing protein [Erythrobacter sp.]MDJ0977827.1 SH3 domain-containing protein [Erythrobacter sp.]